MRQLDLCVAPSPPTHEDIDLRCCDTTVLLMSVRGAGLVVADPPWLYRNGGNGRASAHYDLLSMADIAAHIEASWDCAADDAYLLVWSTFATMGEWWEATAGMRWNYKTGGAWVKPNHVGTGFHIRGNAEPLLIYTKGKPSPSALAVGAHSEKPIGHSEKPLAWARQHVRAFCPPGGLVFDVYAGMAPYARACASERRSYVGAEIDPDRHARALGLLAHHRGAR